MNSGRMKNCAKAGIIRYASSGKKSIFEEGTLERKRINRLTHAENELMRIISPGMQSPKYGYTASNALFNISIAHGLDWERDVDRSDSLFAIRKQNILRLAVPALMAIHKFAGRAGEQMLNEIASSCADPIFANETTIGKVLEFFGKIRRYDMILRLINKIAGRAGTGMYNDRAQLLDAIKKTRLIYAKELAIAQDAKGKPKEKEKTNSG